MYIILYFTIEPVGISAILHISSLPSQNFDTPMRTKTFLNWTPSLGKFIDQCKNVIKIRLSNIIKRSNLLHVLYLRLEWVISRLLLQLVYCFSGMKFDQYMYLTCVVMGAGPVGMKWRYMGQGVGIYNIIRYFLCSWVSRYM